MTASELLRLEVRENTIREILLILGTCKDLDEAKQKIGALIDK